MTPAQIRRQAAAYRAWKQGKPEWPIIDAIGHIYDISSLVRPKSWKDVKVHHAHVAKGVARADQADGQ